VSARGEAVESGGERRSGGGGLLFGWFDVQVAQRAGSMDLETHPLEKETLLYFKYILISIIFECSEE